MTGLFERVVLPVAEAADAKATCQAVREYLESGARVVAVHVVEKAGGAPDKASVEQREAGAERAFDVIWEELGGADVEVETRLAYGTDVAGAILEVADEVDATAVVFVPRAGSRWVRLLTGDVALSLITETDRPVIALPAPRSDE